MSRADASARRRRALYATRVAAARTERSRVHALVWWWMAELRRLPADRRITETARLDAITRDLNERSTSRDDL